MLDALITLSHNLGDPAKDYVILDEGSTASKVDEDTFWVKADGVHLRHCRTDDFVHMQFASLLAMFDGQEISLADFKKGLIAAKIDSDAPTTPTLDAALYAICLTLPGVHYVAHLYPTPVATLTCSANFETAVDGRLIPPEVGWCGISSLAIPYRASGPRLANAVRRRLNAYLDNYGEAPKTVFLQNQGMLVLAESPTQLENIVAMTVKAAQILIGTYAMGGPRFLTTAQVREVRQQNR